MANWIVNTADTTEVVNNATAVKTVELTITNVINGVHTGYNLSAGNFTIGGGTYNSGTGLWTGGNVDSEVNSVKFTDVGLAGDPSNTVKVEVELKSYTPTAAQTIYIDIDEVTAASEEAPSKRNICLLSQWDYDANQTISVTDITSITETNTVVGSATAETVYKHSGTVNDNVSTKVAEITFTASSGYHYDIPDASMSNLTYGGYDYGPYYNTEVVPTYSGSNISSFVVKVHYTPPPQGPLTPDPLTNMCELQHTVRVTYRLTATPSAVTNTITKVEWPSSMIYDSTNALVAVHGTNGAAYTIQIRKIVSDTDFSYAGGNDYYNFVDEVWQSGSANATRTIASGTTNVHSIKYPINTDATDYYTVLINSSSGSTLLAGVPSSPGAAIIKHEGFNSLTISAKSFSGAFGTATTTVLYNSASKSSFTGYGTPQTQVNTLKAGNGGVSGTKINLVQEPAKTSVKTGYYAVKSGGFGSKTFPVTVNVSQGKQVTLDKSVQVDDNSEIKFIQQTGNIHSFEVKVPPARLSANMVIERQPSLNTDHGDTTTFSGDISGFSDIVITPTGMSTVTNAVQNVIPTTTGLVPGMGFHSSSGGASAETIQSVDSTTQVTMTGAVVTRGGADSITFTTPNPNIVPLHIEAYLDEDNFAVITGLLEIRSIDLSSSHAYIYIDNFLTTT